MNAIPLKSTRVTLADKAYKEIRKAIVTLDLKPGQLIYETEIANELNVSRTPVREAFRQLREDQMVEVLPQKGIRVALISKKKVDEVRFIRIALSVSAFRRVAQLWNEEKPECRLLRKSIEKIERDHQAAMDAGDYVACFEADEEFHNTIIGFLNNYSLNHLLSHLNDHANRVRYLELLEKRHMGDIISEHRQIFDMVVSKNEEKVEKLLVEHINKHQCDKSLIAKFPEYFTE